MFPPACRFAASRRCWGLLVRMIKVTLAVHVAINNRPDHLSIPSTRYRPCVVPQLIHCGTQESSKRTSYMEPPSRKVCNNNPSEPSRCSAVREGYVESTHLRSIPFPLSSLRVVLFLLLSNFYTLSLSQTLSRISEPSISLSQRATGQQLPAGDSCASHLHGGWRIFNFWNGLIH